ncbi:U3 small nucleolar RNA-associated protein 18 homolog [Procambarus clarkii]|uniref:U3 small nucleolar RNA-associated protein 18 homolog n=1 Tax=Procambarus clarkii TaxID=6728 RepID=UPI003741FDF0
MKSKGSLSKKINKVTKMTAKNLKRKKNKRNKTSLRVKEFSLDTCGSSVATMTGKRAQKTKISKLHKSDVLGYDSLAEKERSLATDLFGEDADLPESVSQEALFQDVPPASTAARGRDEISQMIPDDPFDVHQPVVKDSKKPAWVDEDDDTIRVKDVVSSMTKVPGKRGIREVSNEIYEMKLREKFSQVVGNTPEWAVLDRSRKGDSDDEDEMARSTGNYLSEASSVNLNKKWLEYKKVHSVNHASRSEGTVIKAAEFNPHFQVGLVAGFSNNDLGAATLFQVDGVHNFKIQSVKFPKFPIKCAKFMQDGKKFVLGSNMYGHFYVYDMEAAKEIKIHCSKREDRQCMKKFVVSPDGKLLVFLGSKGLLHVYDTTALSHVETLHAPQEIKAAAFNENGSKMYTHGDGGDVLVWDMVSLTCVHRFFDDGCIDGTSIAVSPSNQYLACGSSSGIVNIYDMASVSSKTPCPVKILDKLVTPVTALTFNSSSEILGMASNAMDSAMKLVHFPSMTYFNNFPGGQYSLRKVQVLNFSPKSGFLTAGNNFGSALLYRLQHFSSY